MARTPEEKREAQRARTARYRAAHPGRQAEAVARYRERNREKVKAADRVYAARYREKNPPDRKTEEWRAYQREYKRKHPQDRCAYLARPEVKSSLAASRRRKRAADPEHEREVALKRMYGLTLEQYADMLTTQGGRCAICRTADPNSRSTRWHVDHDHTTGKVRGLLCNRCNVMLGMARDDPEKLAGAIAYLKDHESAGTNVIPLRRTP